MQSIVCGNVGIDPLVPLAAFLGQVIEHRGDDLARTAAPEIPELPLGHSSVVDQLSAAGEPLAPGRKQR